VANAILDGTDAVMLSEESAMGAFPVESVQVLEKVALATEPTLMDWRFLAEEQNYQDPSGPSAAISHAVCLLAKDLQPAAIVATTHSGGTARLISLYRPPTPIVGLSSSLNVCRQLCLSWGVVPILNSHNRQMQEIMNAATTCVSNCKLAAKGDRVIITTGFPTGSSTNLIKVADVQ
jgi:pyruvate kinase